VEKDQWWQMRLEKGKVVKNLFNLCGYYYHNVKKLQFPRPALFIGFFTKRDFLVSHHCIFLKLVPNVKSIISYDLIDRVV